MGRVFLFPRADELEHLRCFTQCLPYGGLVSLLAFLFLASYLLGPFGNAPNIPPVRSASSAVCEPGLHGIILFILHQNEHFATDFGKPPIIFENPTYTSKDTAITAAQPTSAPVRNHSPF